MSDKISEKKKIIDTEYIKTVQPVKMYEDEEEDFDIILARNNKIKELIEKQSKEKQKQDRLLEQKQQYEQSKKQKHQDVNTDKLPDTVVSLKYKISEEKKPVVQRGSVINIPDSKLDQKVQKNNIKNTYKVENIMNNNSQDSQQMISKLKLQAGVTYTDQKGHVTSAPKPDHDVSNINNFQSKQVLKLTKKQYESYINQNGNYYREKPDLKLEPKQIQTKLQNNIQNQNQIQQLSPISKIQPQKDAKSTQKIQFPLKDDYIKKKNKDIIISKLDSEEIHQLLID